MGRTLPRSASGSGLLVRPGPEAFRELAERWPMVPVWADLLADVATPVGSFPSLAGSGPGVILESVERSERWGRYSFVAGDPAAIVTVDREGIRIGAQARDLAFGDWRSGSAAAGEAPHASVMRQLAALAAAIRAPRIPGLPTLAGGLVGALDYEAAWMLDEGLEGRLPPAGTSVMRFAVFDRAAVFDHWKQRLVLVAHVPAGKGYGHGVEALEELAASLRFGPSPSPALEALPEPAPPSALTADLGEQAFMDGVRTIKRHIVAGDIFQAVLSRRLSARVGVGEDEVLAIYRRLRVTNPSPYMFLLRLPGQELAGSSPEPLVRVEGSRVMTRPIAGTRPRHEEPDEDARLEAELLADPKERAEHAMLVDLARNDLGRVCRAGTVTVTELMQVERFSRVHHLVSTVEGELRDGLTALDALEATFPAGTVTGAPKRRAMEIVAGLEPGPRGAYAGAVGYLSFAGDLDFCITIRTVVVADGMAHVQAGAGIVADSDPDLELRETKAKAAAILAAVGDQGGKRGGDSG